jgi:cytochrome c553
MIKKSILFLLLFAAGSFVLFSNVQDSYSQTPKEGYAGAEKCALCHGDLVKSWKTTRHAKALESLKKKSQETLPVCVKCHVTGFEKDGGFVDQELTPELAGVQCEACHGPAAVHASDPMNKKNLIANPAEKTCRSCHTVGQDPKFDFSAKRKLVHGDSQKGDKQ